MASQGSTVQATQQLSQSIYDDILNKSRRVGQGNVEQEADQEETQHTLNEGDEGHVDLTSSFVLRQELENENSHEPDYSSPILTQPRLSQFPESQRFKTPVAIGKKRDYNGNIVETPELPRNPLLRNGDHSAIGSMGLSQAFAATQAGSSPFPVTLLGNPLSDRPSPNIELQTRPATATTSSPLQQISEFQRATTEPASRYVSIKQSQAERNRLARLHLLNGEENGGEDFDDDFGQEPSPVWRQRRIKERERKIKESLQHLTSPRPVSAPGLPVPKSLHMQLRGAESVRLGPLDSDELSTSASDEEESREGVAEQGNESEEETEQEDEGQAMVNRSSQHSYLDEEDKENFSEQVVQIPETTVRLQRVLNNIPTEVQASPSLRHSFDDENTSAAAAHSSEPFAVANSQPSQSWTRQWNRQRSNSSVAGEGADFLPRSQDGLAFLSNLPVPLNLNKSVESRPLEQMDGSKAENEDLAGERDSRNVPEDQSRLATSDGKSSRNQRTSTIPETTSSSQKLYQTEQQKKTRSPERSRGASSDDRTRFETAQTSQKLSAIDVSISAELSSPPINTTPPGKKRQRMADIAAEPSPHQSSAGFDAVGALELDVEFQNASDQSPIRVRRKSPKRTLLRHSSSVIEEAFSESQQEKRPGSIAVESDITKQRVEKDKTTNNLPQSSCDSVGQENLISDLERSTKPASILGDGSVRHTSPRRTRASTWDLEELSPPNVVRSARKLNRRSKRQDTETSKVHENATRVETESAFSPPEQHGQLPNEIPGRGNPGVSKPSESVAIDESSHSPTEDVDSPNMVFACFNGKTRAYYPAICLGVSESDGTRYQIQWEGYSPDEVDAFGVKSLDLQLGDQVKVNLDGFPKITYIVRGFKDKIDKLVPGGPITDIRGFKTLVVAPKQRKSLPADVSTDSTKDVPISAIYLDSNMWNQMKNRIYEYRQPQQIQDPASGLFTPAERPATPSTPSSRSRRLTTAQTVAPSTMPIPANPIPSQSTGVFSNMAFAISYEDTARKNTITDLIRDNDGYILSESFLELLLPQSDTNKIELKPQFSDLGFTALLTDRHSRKEKYMQALALGIPCLSGKWIEACCEINGTSTQKKQELANWQTYLLPAGESVALDGATRSRTLPQSISSRDASELKLQSILDSRPQGLSSTSAVVVTGRGKAEIKRKPYLFLIQALGAEKVMRAVDLEGVKEILLQNNLNEMKLFDWIFVDDRDVSVTIDQVSSLLDHDSEETKSSGYKRKKRKSDPGRGKCKVAGNELIVQSLILGRLCESE